MMFFSIPGGGSDELVFVSPTFPGSWSNHSSVAYFKSFFIIISFPRISRRKMSIARVWVMLPTSLCMSPNSSIFSFSIPSNGNIPSACFLPFSPYFTSCPIHLFPRLSVKLLFVEVCSIHSVLCKLFFIAVQMKLHDIYLMISWKGNVLMTHV